MTWWLLGPLVVLVGLLVGLVVAAAILHLSLPLLTRGRRPQAGDKPVQIGSTPDYTVTLADVVADLTAGGSTVAAEFLPPADRVDRRTFATGGVILVPDDVAPLPADLTATDPLILRTYRPDAGRLEHGGLWSRRAGATLPGVRGALGLEAARVRRAAYQQLLHDRAARRAPAVPEPTVGPVGPSGVSSANRRGPHGSVDVRAAVPLQADVPRPPPRPSPGRPSRQ